MMILPLLLVSCGNDQYVNTENPDFFIKLLSRGGFQSQGAGIRPPQGKYEINGEQISFWMEGMGGKTIGTIRGDTISVSGKEFIKK
jgi:hypothetical protein